MWLWLLKPFIRHAALTHTAHTKTHEKGSSGYSGYPLFHRRFLYRAQLYVQHACIRAFSTAANGPHAAAERVRCIIRAECLMTGGYDCMVHMWSYAGEKLGSLHQAEVCRIEQERMW